MCGIVGLWDCGCVCEYVVCIDCVRTLLFIQTCSYVVCIDWFHINRSYVVVLKFALWVHQNLNFEKTRGVEGFFRLRFFFGGARW